MDSGYIRYAYTRRREAEPPGARPAAAARLHHPQEGSQLDGARSAGSAGVPDRLQARRDGGGAAAGGVTRETKKQPREKHPAAARQFRSSNNARETPDCRMMPSSVPVRSSLCCGTGTEVVLSSVRFRMIT
jgi:hypothetical protein